MIYWYKLCVRDKFFFCLNPVFKQNKQIVCSLTRKGRPEQKSVVSFSSSLSNVKMNGFIHISLQVERFTAQGRVLFQLSHSLTQQLKLLSFSYFKVRLSNLFKILRPNA